MKKILLLSLILSGGMISAQNMKNLGDFDELKVFDRITVTLIPSDENKISISGQKSGDVEVVNTNGQLKIRMSIGRLLDGENVEAKLYFKKLNSVDASEGSQISCDQFIKQTAMEITVKEGAEITLGLEVGKAEVKAVTGGIVNLSGTSNTLEAKLGTGGILNAKDFVTTQTDISINAGGEAKVNASELVDANVKAGGNVTIYGHPKQIEKKTTLGGTIEESRR